MSYTLHIGAQPDTTGTHFRVWAPNAHQVEVIIYDGNDPTASHILSAEAAGYHSGHIKEIRPGTRYMYRLDGGDPRPDPASRFQPETVHGPSQVVDPLAFTWTDGDWHGLPLEDLMVYELHVGTATPDGTFESLIERLDELRTLGITAIELMPVADFPGDRNWGYDGVDLFAPARAYGGPEGLRRLVNAAHERGLAVLLDVVYNHFGPDGNYLRQYSTAYFTDRHHTPWGAALNFDGPDSHEVREFFIANACYWAHEYHLDGLRLDATHAIVDDSPTHILAEMVARVHETLPAERHFLLIAENEHNDPQLVRPPKAGGLGLNGVWADDFHHQVRVALAGDRDGYYEDYNGSTDDLATTIEQGWFYIGQESPHLKRFRGAPADDVAPMRFVYCIQNHDQVGNRATGDRIHHTIELIAYRAASVLLLLAPQTPMLFMGQEWAATTPFLFFTHHNEELGKLVTQGRRAEFASFTDFSGEQVPDPQALDTFQRSKLRWEERDQMPHAGVYQLYRDLITLRQQHLTFRNRSREHYSITALGDSTVVLRYTVAESDDVVLVLINLRGEVQLDLTAHTITSPPAGRTWQMTLDSEDTQYGGSGTMSLGEVIRLSGARALVLTA